MKKIAILEIKGGLGNQLFILNFIDFLEKNNFKVYSITSFYESQKNNSLNTDSRELYLYGDFLRLNIPSKKCSNFLSFILNLPNRRNSFWINVLFKISKLFICYVDDSNLVQKIKSSKNIFFFDGYFQNYDFLQSNVQLIKRLSLDPKFKFDNSITDSNLAAVHVRRRDYLNMSEELGITYYQNALGYLKKTIGDFNFNVFTDDVEWCKNNSLFNEAVSIKEASLENTIDHFIEMTTYKNFIISNSTYSYMAAYLSTEVGKVVVEPKPWFKKLEYIEYDEILNPNWKVIENE
jgi:hypothetical protein